MKEEVGREKTLVCGQGKAVFSLSAILMIRIEHSWTLLRTGSVLGHCARKVKTHC